jgi:hypothetical protein
VFENRVVGRIFGPKREKVARIKGRKRYIMRSFMFFYSLTDLDMK